MNETRRTTLKLIAGAAALAAVPIRATAADTEVTPHIMLMKFPVRGTLADLRLHEAKNKLYDIGFKLRTAPITPATQFWAETMLRDAFYNEAVDHASAMRQPNAWLKRASTRIEDGRLKMKVELFTIDLVYADAAEQRVDMLINEHEMECWLTPHPPHIAPVMVNGKPMPMIFTTGLA